MGEGAVREVVPSGVQLLSPLLPVPAGDPALPACPSAAQSTWPCCRGPRPWAWTSSRHCPDSTMLSTSIRCVPWGHTHPPRHTSMFPCLFTAGAANPGQCPHVYGHASALHTCWLPLLAPGTTLAQSIQRLLPCSLAQAWAESVRGSWCGGSSAPLPPQSTFHCARLAAGAGLQLVDAVLTGAAHNGLALVR